MLAALPLVALLAVGSPATDTVLRVERGDHLHLSRIGGVLHVEATDGSELEIAVDGWRGGYRLDRDGSQIRVRASSRGHSADVPREYHVRAPRWLDLEVDGQEVEVDVRGLRADVSLRIQEGDVRLRDVQGTVSVRALDGGVWLEDVRGNVNVDAPDDEILVQRGAGAFVLSSVDGDVDVLDVDARSLEVATIDGDVRFRGSLAPGSRSSITTHDGNITLALPPDASLEVRARARQGSFSASFPIEAKRLRNGTELEFRMGAGEATLRVETFDGDVRVRGLGENDREQVRRDDRSDQRTRHSRGEGR